MKFREQPREKMSSSTGLEDEKKSNLKIKIYSGKPGEWDHWKLKCQTVLNGKGLLATLKSKKPSDSASREVKEA